MSMFDVSVNITFSEVVTGLLLYGIIHGIYKLVFICLRRLETEAGRTLIEHTKNGHKDRFKYCLIGSCTIPGIVKDQLRQAIDRQAGVPQ